MLEQMSFTVSIINLIVLTSAISLLLGENGVKQVQQFSVLCQLINLDIS